MSFQIQSKTRKYYIGLVKDLRFKEMGSRLGWESKQDKQKTTTAAGVDRLK